jgi:hypothetical protein
MHDAMNPSNPGTLARCDRATMIEGLRRRQAKALGDGSDLRARCMACDAHVHDWRRLLGVGAAVSESGADGSTVLTHPGACNACGCSALVLTGGDRVRAAA